MNNKILILYTVILAGLISTQLFVNTYVVSKLVMAQFPHPLNGTIYDPSQNRFVEEAELVNILQSTKVLLVGESHDNLEHHQKQVEFIKRFLSVKQTGMIAMEMITNTQLEAMMQEKPKDSDQIIQVLSQEQVAWNYEHYYKGVFQAIYDTRFKITAANLNQNKIRNIVDRGESEIPLEIKSIMDRVALKPEEIHRLKKEIDTSHCSIMNNDQVSGMVIAQRVRDAYMAKAVFDATSKADKVILLAGNGHIRNDRGVPVYVKELSPGLKFVSIGLVEVLYDKFSPKDYAKRLNSETLPYDYVWFTTKVDRPDQCENLESIERPS